ncbi:MAG TPA: lipoprotein-releasing system transmembrane subunit LolC, partial [Bdellovibrionota bacterium]|nr:lipoprotein-releasing system transmembrane subunit LolC [Bdellovibrionota bacterium]
VLCLFIERSSFLKLPDIYYQQNIPVEMKLFYFIIISVTALVISLLVTYLPARQASKITPLEGIRYVKQ